MEVAYLLDTNIVLYLLVGKIEKPLPQAPYFVSVITEMELLSYPSLNVKEEHTIRSFLSEVAIVGLTPTIKTKAIEVRRKNNLRLPDAIIAATSFCIEATLLTNDNALLMLSEISTRSVPILS